MRQIIYIIRPFALSRVTLKSNQLHLNKKKTTVFSSLACAWQRVNPCAQTHEEHEAHFKAVTSNQETTGVNFDALTSNSPLYLPITECSLCVPHHYKTEEFTLTFDHGHPLNCTAHSSLLKQVPLEAFRYTNTPTIWCFFSLNLCKTFYLRESPTGYMQDMWDKMFQALICW